MTRGLRRSVGLGLIVAIAFAGCGGGHRASDEQLVAGVLHSFLRAQADGEGQAACRLLSPGARRTLVALVASKTKALGMAPSSCEQAVGLVRAVAPPKLLSALRSARVERIAVEGAAATADVVDGTAFPRQRVRLSKSGGAWRITSVPTLIVT